MTGMLYVLYIPRVGSRTHYLGSSRQCIVEQTTLPVNARPSASR